MNCSSSTTTKLSTLSWTLAQGLGIDFSQGWHDPELISFPAPAFGHHLPSTEDHYVTKVPNFWRTSTGKVWRVADHREKELPGQLCTLSAWGGWGWSQALAGTQSFRHSKARADGGAQPFPSPLYGTDFSKGDNPGRRGYTDNTQQAWWRHALWNPLYGRAGWAQISQISGA